MTLKPALNPKQIELLKTCTIDSTQKIYTFIVPSEANGEFIYEL